MDLEFDGELIFWRRPSPHHFVTVPDEPSAALESASPNVSYGWGCIPVTATSGATTWTTSLFPKTTSTSSSSRWPVRKAEGLELGDVVTIRLDVAI